MRTSTASSNDDDGRSRFPRELPRSAGRRAARRRQRRDRSEGRAEVSASAANGRRRCCAARRGSPPRRPLGRRRMAGGRFEVGVGVAWTGRHVGWRGGRDRDGAVGPPHAVLDLDEAGGCRRRRGARRRSADARAFAVEASSSYSRPTLRTAISGDLESGAPITATEAMRQFTIDGAVVMYLTGSAAVSAALTPFVDRRRGLRAPAARRRTRSPSTASGIFAGGGITYAPDVATARVERCRRARRRARAASAQRSSRSTDGLHASPAVPRRSSRVSDRDRDR